MKEIKTKATASSPKILETAVRLPRQVKEAAINNRDRVEEIISRDNGEQPEQYAADQTTKGAAATAQKGSGAVRSQMKQLARKGWQANKQHAANDPASPKASPSSSGGSSFTGGSTAQSTRSTSVGTRFGLLQADKPAYSAGQNAKQSTDVFAKIKSSGRKDANNVVKTAEKSVKTAKRTAKASARTIKTSAKAVKTTVKTAKTAVRSSAQAARIARATAKAIATGIKLMIKAIIAAVKAIIAATKALVAAIAAGGWVVVIVIIVIGVIAFLLASPFGIFVNGGAEGTPSVSDVVQELNGEFSSMLEDIKQSAGPVDEVKIAFVGDDEKASLDNWPDILGVFAVSASLNSENPLDVVVMDDQRIDMLRQVFWKMVSVEHSVTELPPEPTTQVTTTPEATIAPTATPIPKRILNITVSTLCWDDVLPEFGFTEQQLQMLKALMSSQNYSMLESLANTASGNPATDWSGVIDVPAGGMPIPLYLQGDYPQAVCYIDGAAKSVKSSGCGATSVSMVIAYLTGNTSQNPYTLFKWAYENGYYSGNGLGHSCLSKLASLYGVKGTWIKNDASLITEALQEGHPVIAHMGPGIFTSGGHYIVLRGITDDGHVLVNDPGSRKRNRYAYKLSTVVAQARTNSSFMVCEH